MAGLGARPDLAAVDALRASLDPAAAAGTADRRGLTERELQVLRLVASGRTNKAIARDLSLSEKTIATYRSRISEKLGLSTNVELTRYAMQNRLVE